MKPTGIIYVITAVTGEYNPVNWTVDAWTTRELAQERCDALNKIASEYSSKDREHGSRCPDIKDDSPESNAAFDRWIRKKESMERSARRKARDPALVVDSSYSVLPIMVMQ